MALLNASESLLRFEAFISENSTALNIAVIFALLVVSYAYLAGSSKEKNFPRWLPLEIGAVMHLISSDGLGLSI